MGRSPRLARRLRMGRDLDDARGFENVVSRLPRELRVLLALAPAAMAYVDRDRCFRYTNARFDQSVAQQFPDGVIGLHVEELVSEAFWERIRPSVDRALSGRASAHEEERSDGGNRSWTRSVLIPDTEAGETLGYVLMITDITRRKLAEQALEAERSAYAHRLEVEVAQRTAELRELQKRLVDLERLKDAEQMAGAVAHAVQNPLTALLGTVQMAQRGMLEPPLAFERAELLAKRIAEVVDGTLWMYRRGKIKLQAEPLDALIEAVKLELMAVASARGVELVSSVDADAPAISADRTLLVSALVCVVDNAIQATPENGRVTIEVEPLLDAGGARVRIMDEGPGIPAHLREKVLEPFYTTKPRGTGFGLAIASSVVDVHGGALRILDRPEGGTAIEIDLVAAETAD